jgi:hypothetical protein
MRPSPIPKVRSRQINDADIDGVVDLLTRGFPLRTRGYWQRALKKLSLHQTPAEMPKFGYLLEAAAISWASSFLFFRRFPATRRGCVATSRAGTSSRRFEATLR